MKAWFEKGELIVSACHMSFDIVDCNNKIDTEPADKRPVEKHSKNWKQLNGINESVKKSDSHSKIVSVFRVNKEDIKALRDSELNDEDSSLHNEIDERTGFFSNFDSCSEFCGFLNRFNAEGGSITEDDYRNLNEDWSKLKFFNGCYKIDQDKLQTLKSIVKQVGNDINLNWIDTSEITDMSGLFSGLYYFNGDISKWNVSNVTNIESMFKGCAEFNCDISKWNVEKAENMDDMFNGCLAFNQDIKQWNVSNVKKKNNVFRCSGICDKFNPFASVAHDDTTCSCDTEHHGFANFPNQEIYDVGNNDHTKQSVKKHSDEYIILKKWLDVGDYSYNAVMQNDIPGDLDFYFSCDWGDDRFNSEQEMILKNIYDNISFIQGDFKTFVDTFDKRITMPDGLEENFYTYVQCKDFFVGFYRPSGEDFINNLRHYLQNADANVNLNWIDTSKLTDMSNLFSGLYYFNGDISQWDVSNVTNMEGMFEGCVEFDGDLSDWAINENTRTVNMFRLCGIDDDNKPKMK